MKDTECPKLGTEKAAHVLQPLAHQSPNFSTSDLPLWALLVIIYGMGLGAGILIGAML